MKAYRPFSTSKTKFTNLPPEEAVSMMTRYRSSGKIPSLGNTADQIQSVISNYKQSSQLISQKSLALDRFRRQKQQHSIMERHRLIWQEQMTAINQSILNLGNELEEISVNYGILSIPSDSDNVKVNPGDCQMIVDQILGLYQTVRGLTNNLSDPTNDSFDEMEIDRWLYSLYDIDQRIEESLGRLEEEEQDLAAETQIYRKKFSRKAECDEIYRDLPQDILEIECQDPEIKRQLIEHFESLADQYHQHLSSIQKPYNQSQFHCQEQDLIAYVYQTYNNVHVIKRTQMMQSRLKMQLHQIPTAELEAQLELFSLNHFLQLKREALHDSWLRHRNEMIEQIRCTIEESNKSHQESEQKSLSWQVQKAKQLDAHLKLNQLRKQKFEHQVKEIQEQEEKKQKLQLRVEKEQAKWQQARQLAKEKLEQYHEKQSLIQKQMEEQQLHKLAELERLKMEQAEKNRERVGFRRERYVERLKSSEEKYQQRIEEQQKIEIMLEKLRQKVEVHVKRDPARLLKQTASSTQAKKTIDMKPLFKIDGYQDEKVMRDPRLRLTMILSERGLLHNEYARKAMAALGPDKQPRRDIMTTASNPFLSTEQL